LETLSTTPTTHFAPLLRNVRRRVNSPADRACQTDVAVPGSDGATGTVIVDILVKSDFDAGELRTIRRGYWTLLIAS